MTAVLLMALLFFSGCEKEEEAEVSSSSNSAESYIPIRINLNEDEQNSELLQSAIGTVDDVTSVVVSVTTADDSQTVLGEAVLKETYPGSKIWEGVLADIPSGIELEFEASAYNEDGEILFTDTVLTTISVDTVGVIDVDIVFEMESVDDGVQPDNPKILSVVIPEEVSINSVDNEISFQIEHSSEIEYEFDLDYGSLSTPMSGTHDPAANLDVLYNAPGSAGQDIISIRIKDPDSSDSVGAIFPISVVDGGSSVAIDIKFGPVITGVQFVRGEDFLMVSATTDPETGLSYEWAGTGSFSTLAETENPVIIKPFDDNYAGTITVTVTDTYGLTSEVVREISAGDFPYVVVQPLDPEPDPEPDPDPEIPDGTVVDEDTGLMWQDNGETSRMSWSDAQYFCENGLELGGYNDWRLPTLSELIIAYFHRDIFASYQKFGYWSSTHYLFDNFRAWSLRFSSGFDRIGQKKHKRMVRCVRDL